MNKPTNLMFMLTLILSVMISISSNSWFTMWMGMEINLMSFMPLISEKNNSSMKESALTYFLVQAIASMIFMMSIVMMIYKNQMEFNKMKNFSKMIMMSSLAMKSGMSPFHFWMPKMMEGIDWNKCLILMTWQKLIPLMIMSKIIENTMWNLFIMMSSVIVGAIGGLNQTSLRKLMAYSSISNNGWMMAAMLISEMTWLTFFSIYTIMTMVMTNMMNFYKNYHINQLLSMNEITEKKLMIMMNILSISGLPPMMGFLPKWMLIQMMSNSQLFLMFIMLMTTMIMMYYYLRMMFSSLMIMNTKPKWNKLSNKINKKMMIMNKVSIMGLTMITLTLSLI
nr:NADH dehydrogenase subunit 2 [Nanhuaphasma hamicercum]